MGLQVVGDSENAVMSRAALSFDHRLSVRSSNERRVLELSNGALHNQASAWGRKMDDQRERAPILRASVSME